MTFKYVYSKKRHDFGRPCSFVDKPPAFDCIIPANANLFKQHIQMKFLDQATQNTPDTSEHFVNTEATNYEIRGMSHLEGGYPITVDYRDPEQVQRYRKKQEKEDSYQSSVVTLSKTMMHYIEQNIALNIYEHYFEVKEEEVIYTKEDDSAAVNVINYCRDPNKIQESVSHLAWCTGAESKHILGVTYGSTQYQCYDPNYTRNAYTWDIHDLTKPVQKISPPSMLVTMEFCPKDETLLVGGCQNGQLVLFDTRKGPTPVEMCALQHRHHEPCFNVAWWQSKTASELFSASTDGKVMWWDIRKFKEPMEQIVLYKKKANEPKNPLIFYGARTLEYEPTIPTKFNIGTEDGSVLNCNRKAQGEKVTAVLKRHTGPILGIQRNHSFNKNLLTVGDYTAKVTSEDARDCHIFSTPNEMSSTTHCTWSLNVPSIFFVCKDNGYLDIWDLLVKQEHSVYSIKVSSGKLTYIKLHESGTIAASGTSKGTIIIMKLSSAISVADKNNKTLISAYFEREGRREKIMETRVKELSIKKKQQSEMVQQESNLEEDSMENLGKVGKNFLEIVDQHTQLMKANMKKTESAVLGLRAEHMERREKLESIERGDEFKELEEEQEKLRKEEREREEQERLKMEQEEKERDEEFMHEEEERGKSGDDEEAGLKEQSFVKDEDTAVERVDDEEISMDDDLFADDSEENAKSPGETETEDRQDDTGESQAEDTAPTGDESETAEEAPMEDEQQPDEAQEAPPEEAAEAPAEEEAVPQPDEPEAEAVEDTEMPGEEIAGDDVPEAVGESAPEEEQPAEAEAPAEEEQQPAETEEPAEEEAPPEPDNNEDDA